MDLYPSGVLEPIYASEYVSDGLQSFYTDTTHPPPTNEQMIGYEPTLLAVIGSWISDFTKYIWQKRTVRDDTE